MEPLDRTAAPAPGAVALGEVLNHARSACLRVISHFGIPAADAEDLLQDAFVLYVERIDQIEAPERWLPATVRILCLRYRRARRRQLARAVDSAMIELLSDPRRSGAERLALRQTIDRAFGLLRERCRQLLALRYSQELAAEQIARQLGCKPTSVNKIAQRCVGDFGERLVEVGRSCAPPAQNGDPS
jgi:RNA polymerase sigma factor (sigma-70 family)